MSDRQFQWAWCLCPICRMRHIDLIPLWDDRGRRVDPSKEKRVTCDRCLAGKATEMMFRNYIQWRDSVAPCKRPTRLDRPGA